MNTTTTAQQEGMEQQAIAFAEAGDYTSAIPLFQALTEANPTEANPTGSWKAWEMLAQCLLEVEEWERALAAAQQAVSLCPTWGEAWLTLAHCQYNSFDLAGCEVSLQKVLQLNPTHTVARKELEDVKQWQQQQNQAGQSQPTETIPLPFYDENVENTAAAAKAAVRCVIVITEWRSPLPPPAAGATCGHCIASSDSCSSTSNTVAGGCGCCNYSSNAGGPGFVLWHCGKFLARFSSLLLAKEFRQASVLELGSGTGVVAIALGSLGASVVATDLPEVLPLLRHNIAQNQHLLDLSGGKVTPEVLNWKEVSSSSMISQLLNQFATCLNFVVASDTIYNVATIPSFVRTLSLVRAYWREKAASSSMKTNTEDWSLTLLLMHKQRNPVVEETLLTALASEGIFISLWKEECTPPPSPSPLPLLLSSTTTKDEGVRLLQRRGCQLLLAEAREQKCVLYWGRLS